MARAVLKPNSGTTLDNISMTLRELRETQSETRQALYDKLFYYLGIKKMDTYKAEAFLIKTANRLFGEFTTDADTALMALGLLEGYDYNSAKNCKQRRIKFLKESTYLAKKGNITSYVDADEKLQSNYEDSLRATDEPSLLLEMANFMLKPENHSEEYMSDIDKYIDDGVAIFPIPGYIKRKPLQDRIKMAVIKYTFPDNKSFTERQHILINRNNECEIEIDLSKKQTDRPTKRIVHAVSTVAVSFFVITAVFIFRLFDYGQGLKPDTIHDNGAGTMISADAEPIPNNKNNEGAQVPSF